MKKRFLSVLCGLIIVASTISINVSAVGSASQDYTVATNESVLSGSLSVEGGSCSSDDIITLSTDVQTVSAGSSELSDGQSQDINVYLTTTIEDESSNSDENSGSDGTSNSSGTSQTNGSQTNSSAQNQNNKSSKNNPITGDIGIVLPAIILIISASLVLLLAYFIRKRRS